MDAVSSHAEASNKSEAILARHFAGGIADCFNYWRDCRVHLLDYLCYVPWSRRGSRNDDGAYRDFVWRIFGVLGGNYA